MSLGELGVLRGLSGVGEAGDSLGVDVSRMKYRGTLLLSVQKNH